MKRNSYDIRRNNRREIFRERVKETEKNWPRITNTKTYQFFITRERIYKLK